MKIENVKISAFCTTTNAIKWQFPFIESIKSFLPIVDELIVIDGGSTDGTIEAIQAIGDSKIKIIQDEDTIWEDEWAYARMGHNFNRGLQECTGDWAIKFDVDYILHENCYDKFHIECNRASRRGKVALAFTRVNFILSDRFYVKSKKTLAINKTKCREVAIDVKYGLDTNNWGWGFDFIDFEFEENGIDFGNMVRETGNSVITSATVFNYDYIFMTLDNAKNLRHRHFLAEQKQRAKKYKKAGNFGSLDLDMVKNDREVAWSYYQKQCLGNLNRPNTTLTINQHPEIIREKISKITKAQQGYDSWGWGDKSSYYE